MIPPARLKYLSSGAAQVMLRMVHRRAPRAIAALLACTVTLGGAPLYAQASASTARPGRVEITSVDSITRLPLAGASVRVVSVLDTTRVYTATLDARGRARVDSLAAGPWVLTAHHARLDTLGVGSMVVPFTVRAGRAVTARAVVPSVQTLASRVCGSAALPGTGYIFGTVRRAVSAQTSPRGVASVNTLPLSPGQVTAQWLDLRVEAGRIERPIVTVEVPVGEDGRYVVCAVPTETTVRLYAAGVEGASGVATFRTAATGIVPRDLVLGRADTVMTTPSDPVAPEDSGVVDMVLRGAGGVRGTVQTSDGRPLANALVGLSATGLDTRTDHAGRFVLAGTPTGTWTLDVRALGYVAWQHPVDIVPDDTVSQMVALVRAQAMDTVRVRATAAGRKALRHNFQAFEERRRAGLGRFIGPAELEEMQLFRFTDLLRGVSGVRLELGSRTDRIITMRGTYGRCVPTVLVDRVRMPGTEALDSFLPPEFVAAVEVYQAGFGPAEFQDIFSGCGTIVVWTGARR